MNLPIPTSIDPAPPPPLPPQPPRSSFSCDRHPHEQFSGFCPACLCERLTTLEQFSSSVPSSSSRRPSASSSSAAAAALIKSLFSSSSSKHSTSNAAGPTAANPPLPKSSNATTSSFPGLRRTKSFSASKQEAFGLNFLGAFEPQRKSCDVRVRNTLWSLFTLDDESKNSSLGKPSASSANVHSASTVINGSCVIESKEEDEEEEPQDEESEIREMSEGIVAAGQEARLEERGDFSLEIVEEEEGMNLSTDKPMKEHFDLDSQSKKPTAGGKDLREIAGNFWSAASVFSKRWQKWRQKQKMKKQNNGKNSVTLPVVEKPRQHRETQSEIADYGFGRRSCDIDPRFSLDAGRISFDDPRYSFDEPRASWDGYLIGRSFPRRNPMVSVVEDDPKVHIARADDQILVEEPPCVVNRIEEDEAIPGGSAQTKEYYADSSSRRRRSLDRTNSTRKSAADVVADIDEMKRVSNSNSNSNSLLDEVDYLQGAKMLPGNRETISNSMRNDCLESFELPGFRDSETVIENRERKGCKKSRRWSWNIWGFIHRRSGGNTNLDGDRFCRSNRVERSFSGSWRYRRWEGNGEARGMLNGKAFRSKSSVSWRHSMNTGSLFGDDRKLGINVNGHRKKQRNEFILERNRSARYSLNDGDNGMLHHQLTPMRSGHKGAIAKGQPNGSRSFARSVLRLY